MAQERLMVKNFGPIKEIDIEVKDVNVLIGTTGSGKSTIAKLLVIFRSPSFLMEHDKTSFFPKQLRDMNIDFPVSDQTEILYESDELFISLQNGKLDSNIHTGELSIHKYYNIDGGGRDYVFLVMQASYPDDPPFSDETRKSALEVHNHKIASFHQLQSTAKEKESNSLASKYKSLEPLNEPLYIPAERSFISMVGSSIMGLLNHDVAIAKCVKDFGAKFETARRELEGFEVGFLPVGYSFEGNQNIILLDSKEKTLLEKTSSGIQSIVPLMVVLESLRKKKEAKDGRFVVIEEPESNLYPKTQKALTEYVAQVVQESGSKLCITTHSPYILTALDNLVQAHNAYRAHPEKAADIEAIIPKSHWLDFDNVSCYFVDQGTCLSTLNHELRTLGSSAIDDASIDTGSVFDQLTDIQFA